MTRTWKVTLFNQHAMCGISAEGRTRREAFERAYNRAGPTHRHYKLAEMYSSAKGADVMWLAAFNDALAYMRPGTTSASHMNPRGFGVEIRRVPVARAWEYVQ